MPQQRTPERVRFSYREGPSYQVVYATGARGAVTPQGRIKFDLFAEFPAAPSEEVRNLNPDGTLVAPVPLPDAHPETVEVMRQLQVGVFMSIGDAEIVAKWLQEMADEAKSIRESAQAAKKERLA
jgi:hypothetical protein